MAKEIKESEKKPVEKEYLAPDGGWGWMVVIGAGLSNIVVIPIIQSFGLIFIDRFNYELDFSSTDVTSLISLNSSFGMILGIFNAPLLKKFGYRKMAYFGITLFTTGVFFTGLATTYVQFLIAYGMIASIGMTCTMGSFSLAMNTYFKNKKKRSKASGFTMTLTGIGPIVMPLLISFLLTTYGVKWTVFILCAINLNAFVGASLLQPIKWHVRKPKDEEAKMEPDNADDESEEKPIEFPDTNSLFGGESSISGSKMSLYRRYGRSQSAVSAVSTGKWQSLDSIPKMKTASQELYKPNWTEKNGFGARRQRSVTCLDNEDYGDMMKSMLSILESPAKVIKPKRLASIETLNFHKEEDQVSGSDKPLLSICSSEENHIQKNGQIYKNTTEEIPEEEKKRGCCSKIWQYIKDLYDLDLLVDPIFLNLMIGMSIAIIGELIFSLLTPFILEELGLDLDQKAEFMSITALTDLVFRFIAPFVGGWLGYGSRAMYVCALFLLLVTRATMFLTSSYEGLLVVAAGLGLGKGFRTVYWGLVIPDYVPLKKYPSAAAFQSLTNGLLLLLSGPLIGFVVAINNRYTNIIVVSNVLTLTTIIMWNLEFLIVRCRKKRNEAEKLEKINN